ncbi:MAG: DUF4886 domain-containing protein [Oscillospiraceae bacterium]|nr:DUF4886 domain-containing protein [Oscillospiraceae bacterium]
MKRRIITTIALLALLLGAITVGAAANSQTLQEAINNAESGATITLYTAATEAISVDKDLVLDLNGNDIFELNVAEGKTVTVFDAQTDDYAVSDGIYGKIYAHSGNVVAAEGYLAVDENNTDEYDILSFHKLTLEITAMSLRTAKEAEQDPGVYYKSNFCGDEVIAAQVAKYGIALNVKEAPNKNNMNTTSAASSFTNFAAGENGNAGTGTLLKGIIKNTNSDANNERNANMPIFGRPYLQLTTGEYIFGNTAQRSLRQQMELVDNNWSNYTEKAQGSVLWMFRSCKDMISDWNIPNILEEMNAPVSDGKTLKLLAISSSFGENTNHYVYDAAMAEGYDTVIVGRLYASGCTLQTHLEKALSGENFYRYTKIQDGTWEEYKNTSMLTALQDEDWDVIFMQQSAHRSPMPETYVSGDVDYIDELVSYVRANKTNPKARFIWNLCWAFENGAPESEVWNRYGKNQLNMYQGLIDTLEQRVLTKNHFDAIIPTGTAVQNLRTSYIGDTLTKDKLHLNHLGRIMAAYTVLATVTGEPITEINISTFAKDNSENFSITEVTEQDKLAIMEAVNNAIANPYEITQSIYTTAE